MSFKVNENQNQGMVECKPITDCAHLIDLPPVAHVFDHKVVGQDLEHPKAGIKVLTAFYHKNGLANLL